MVAIVGYVITAHYQTVMSSKLTVPEKIPEITTNFELIDSNLKLTGIPNIGLILKQISASRPNDKAVEEISKRYEADTGPIKDILLKIVTERKSAFTRTGDNMEYLAQQVRHYAITI